MAIELATSRSGQAQFIEPLARAAVAVGIDGLFVEVHEAPERALSDGPNALRLNLLGGLLEKLRRLDVLAKGGGFRPVTWAVVLCLS